MIGAVIVDDEPIHHDILKRNLSQFCPGVKVVGEFYSGNETLTALPQLAFDILFLDIELGDMNSFEMLKQLPYTDLHIIFITSFDKYALEAFRYHAVDYLLKPVDGAELSRAIERAMDQIISRERQYKLISDYSFNKNSKLLVADIEEYQLIEISSIIYCKSDGNYTNIYQVDAAGIEIRYTDTHNLKYFEEKLKPFRFIRIHQSYLVNREHVTRIRKNPCEVILSSGRCLPVARDRKQDILDDFSLSD